MIPRALGARSTILTFLPALLVFVALWPIARPREGVGDTFQFWYAGHLVATGGSAYDQQAWHAASAAYGSVAANVAANCADPDAVLCAWTYPPLTAWLFAPFGALPPATGVLAVNVFDLITLFAGVAAAVLFFGPREPRQRALVLAAAAAGHPFVVDIAGGHFVGLLLLALVAIAHGLRERQTWPIVVGAIALALKPHVAVVVAFAVPAVLAARGAWRAVASTVAALAIIVGLALLRSPEAIGAIVSRGGAKAGIAWSTTWALADATGEPALTVAAVAVVAVGAAAVAIRSAHADRRDLTIVAVAAALSLVVTPYAQPYDFLLALPAFAAAAAAASALGRPARTALFAVIVLCWIGGTWASIVLGDGARVVASTYAAVPVAALVVLAVALRASHAAPASPRTPVSVPA
ncbi:MAG: glycosyltransferase 87 family protein [Chloroflexota bacterium]|nr:glycosyltransferase 87 family protein [Chloroflexota bacterium]